MTNSRNNNAPTFTPNQSIFIAGWPNIRQSPGYVNQPSDDVMGMAMPGTSATIIAGPTPQDDLIWWRVKTNLEDGTAVQGWVAQVDPTGTTLLSKTPPDDLGDGHDGNTTTDADSGDYAAGTTVYNCCGEPINLRTSAGFKDKDAADLLTLVPAGAKLLIEGGPKEVDALVWWIVSGRDDAGDALIGWVADATPDGMRLISSSLPSMGGHADNDADPQLDGEGPWLAKPFDGTFAVSQWWGGNRDFYKDFLYDGVPLRGHNGMDFATYIGTPLIAVDDGQIIKVDYEHNGFGHHILIRHLWGESLYAHLDQVGALHGAGVNRGQQIGTTGDSGAGAAHLHFGIRLTPYRRTDGWGGFTDPKPFMKPADLVRSRSAHAPTPMAKEIPGRPRP